MSIDYSVNIVGIFQIVAMVVGGMLVLAALKIDVKYLKDGARALKDDLEAMQGEIKKLGDILVNLADIRGELRVHDSRITAVEQDIREMRKHD